MATTITLTHKLFSEWRSPVRDLIDNLRRRIAASTDTKPQCEKLAEIERAFRTLQLAGNPGEDYEVVAARIEKEAARYKAFLQNPERIGKIALNVKQMTAGSSVCPSKREQYRVNDPAEGEYDSAEGSASVCYTFSRSNNTILEFLVHDEKDEPLFPIARTYTNWIGCKEFELGRNRKFYLNMLEDDPGYVKVHAGFVPLLCKSDSHAVSRRRAVEFLSRGDRQDVSITGRRRRFSLFPSFSNRLGYLTALHVAVVSLVSCAIFWSTMAKPKTQIEPQDAQISGHAMDVPFAALEAPQWPIKLNSLAVTFERHANNTFPSRILHSMRNDQTHADGMPKTAGLPAIENVSVSIDDSGCKERGNDCRKLWSNVEDGLQSRINYLSTPIAGSEAVSDPNKLGRLFVSYRPVDWQHGHIYFTVYDQDHAVWDGSHDFDCAKKEQSVFVNAFCAETSWQILSEMISENSASNSDESQSRAVDQPKRDSR